MKTIFTIIILLNSLSNYAQDSTGKYSIKMTAQHINLFFALLDSSKLPAVEVNRMKADWIAQAQSQQRKPEPVKKEGKKE